MSLQGGYSLPPTAICPGCGAMVTLPAEPIYPDSPPAICATCDTEVPDYRRESYDPAAAPTTPFQPPQQHTPRTTPVQPVASGNPLETKRVSRAGLFRSLGGILAERAGGVVEDTRDRITDTIERTSTPSKE